MFNSELVIADISSINCALYSFTQFQFVLANRSMGKKRAGKTKGQKLHLSVTKQNLTGLLLVKYVCNLGKKLMQCSTVLGILITLHPYQMAELHYSDLKRFQRRHHSVRLSFCCYYPQSQKVLHEPSPGLAVRMSPGPVFPCA